MSQSRNIGSFAAVLLRQPVLRLTPCSFLFRQVSAYATKLLFRVHAVFIRPRFKVYLLIKDNFFVFSSLTMWRPFNLLMAFMALVMAASAAGADLFDEAYEMLESFSQNFQNFKRDDLTVQQIEGIISQVNDSGFIISALDVLAASESQQDSIVNAVAGFIRNGSNPLAGFNVSLNVLEVMDQVLKSGLINSTADTLLKNDQNRNLLASRAGQFLSSEIWVSVVLRDLANGHKLTTKWIADTARSFKPYRRDGNNNKLANLQAVLKAAVSKDDSSDQYAGSAQKFFNNFINAALDSSLVNDSLDDILQALNNTGIISSVVLQVINDTSILKMAGNIILKLYDTGVLDNINLQYYFDQAKKKGYLADGVGFLFTDPNYSPYVGKLFQTLDSNDVFKNIQYGIYGSGEGGRNDGSGS